MAIHGPAPLSAPYNGELFPFTYPPLAFWIYGGLAALGADSFALMRWLPLLTTLACLGLATRLIQRLGAPLAVAGLAVLFLAVLPRSWEWTIQGGGMTRSLGCLFSLLTLLAALRLREGFSRWRVFACGSACAAAGLSHPEWGICAIIGVLVVVGCRRDWRSALTGVVAAGSVAALLALPWYAFSLARHGIAPYQAALATGGHDSGLLSLLGDLAALPSARNARALPLGFDALLRPEWPLWLFALAGLLLAAIERSRLCLLGILAIAWAWATPRHAPTPLTLPLAALAAFGCWRLLGPGLALAWSIGVRRLNLPDGAILRQERWKAAFLILLITWTWYWSRTWVQEIQPLFVARAVSPPIREGFAQCGKHLPADAVLLVVSDAGNWAQDAPMEWAPELSGRRCLGVVQGSEWLPSRAFEQRMAVHSSIVSWAFATPRSTAPDRLPPTLREATHILFCRHLREHLIAVDQLRLDQDDAERLNGGSDWSLYRLRR